MTPAEPTQKPRVRDGIFISYRRQDSQPSTGRLTDDLSDYFGRNRIYRDLDSTRGGQDYVEQINEALARSRALVAVIGSRWASITGDTSNPRLHDPEDLVRLELEVALGQDVAVLPVLVDGAAMPQKGDLPESLHRLSRIQANRLSDDDWEYDLGRLFETLEDHGVLPRAGGDRVADTSQDESPGVVEEVTAKNRFERTMQASRRRCYDAVAGAVEGLGYRVINEDARAATIEFQPRSMGGRKTTAKVVDAGPGRSTVVVELQTVKGGYLAAGSGVAGIFTMGVGFLAWPGLRLWERGYATGFLENVQAVLEGRGLGKDSALLPGTHELRNRTKKV